jgi:hypothetical protein
MLDDLDWTTSLTVKDGKQKTKQLESFSDRIRELERLRNRYLCEIEGDEELNENIISRYKKSAQQLAEPKKNAKESLKNHIIQDSPKQLDGMPMIIAFEANNDPETKEYQLRLRDEVRKRINETVANVKPGKGKIVAKVTFTNEVIKWAVIEGDRAVLLSGGDFVPMAT